MNDHSEDKVFSLERQQAILAFVEENKKATVAELCQIFKVSTSTIRNDLREMEKNMLVTRTHGGVLIRSKTGVEMMSTEKEICNHDAKVMVAQLALEQIEDGDTLLLDTGTTTLELAKILGERQQLTVITNDLKIALTLEDSPGVVNLFFIGGAVRKKLHCVIPFNNDNSLSDLIIDKAIMGTNGFTLKNGATTPDVRQAAFKKKMIACSTSVILLADSTKIGRDAFAKFADTSDIHIFITDSIKDDVRSGLEAQGMLVCDGATTDKTRP